VNEHPNNPYEAPEHGGSAASIGPSLLPINRRRVIRAVLIWIGLLGFGSAINLLYVFTTVPEKPLTWLKISLLVIGMLNSLAFVTYHILLIIWIMRGHFRKP
jgi:hypothetical protein